MFELRDEEINVKLTIAVEDATNAVAKRKPESFQACQDSSPDQTYHCDTGSAF